ncbi:hypothetical protein HYDPIDRAFT_43147, partial [Hydnomerulius pinastri MD-312]
MLARASMTASPLIDSYDAQMLDFSHDLDVPMNTATSTEFFTEALMDHDGHESIYGEHASVEVEMEEYEDENAEYEMADETTQYHHHGDEPLDVEVYDASHAPSPLPVPQPLHPSADVPIEPEHPGLTSPAFSEHSTLPLLTGEHTEAHLLPLDHPVSNIPYVEPIVSGGLIPSDSHLEEPFQPNPSANTPGENVSLVTEPHEQIGVAPDASGHASETALLGDVNNEADAHAPVPSEEHPADPSESDDLYHENPESSHVESAPQAGAEELHDGDFPLQEENAVDPAPVLEGENEDPLEISDGVYIDPPPAVLLSTASSTEVEFSLFNQPEPVARSRSPSVEASQSGTKVYSLLLENRPTLYYEPLSSVFEVLRQEEDLLAHIPHSFEGELVLDAYDLQLVVSEDNVHSRDISLHDLNVLHDGSDFSGPLRLLLRASVPRFIVRYYALQEQIQRLDLAVETGEGEHHDEYEQHIENQEQLHHDPADPATEIQEQETGPKVAPEHSDEQPTHLPEEITHQPDALPSSTQEGATEEEPTIPQPAEDTDYHEVPGEEAQALENEGDYEGTNAGDEDGTADAEGSLDADQVHEAADTDAAASVAGQLSEFGGEQAEYQDYGQPEEYEERYEEDLPEEAGGNTDAQYGQLTGYEEGEQDTSTAVDETQAILPALDPDEAVTPIPAPAALEPEFNDHATEASTSKAPSVQPDNPGTPSAKVTTDEPSSHIANVKDLQEGSRQSNKMNTALPSGEDVSDSNFLAMLEREADAELDRTFTSNSGEKDGVESLLEKEETWDDEWDDEDAEGEDDQDGWIDPDAVSNQSSVTLSSKASSKRGYEEVEFNGEDHIEELQSSPGSKRPR